MFSCNGETVQSLTPTTVQSSIANIAFVIEPSGTTYVDHPQYVEYHLLFVIEVTNSDGEGVPGKVPYEVEALVEAD